MSQETNALKWNSKRDRKTRRQTAKPYSRPQREHEQQSIVSSVASIVKEKFIPNWLKSVANFLIFDSNEVESNVNNEFNENESGDESSSNLNEDDEEEREEEPFPAASSSSAISLNHFNFNKQQRVAKENNEEDEDNASTASSGCSSMAPTSNKFLSSILNNQAEAKNEIYAKINLPKPRSPEFVRRYLQTTSRDIAVETEQQVARRENFQTPALTRKRKAETPASFNADELFSPSIVLPSKSTATTLVTSALVHRSPFYQGRTSFGGASSKRSRFAYATYTPTAATTQVRQKLPIGGNNTLIEIKINNSKQSINDSLSNTAKRILEKIEQQSTPIDDVKKIPCYAPSASSTQITVEPIKPFQSRRSSLINLSTVNPFKMDFIERKNEKQTSAKEEEKKTMETAAKCSLKMNRPKMSARQTAKRKEEDEPVERIEFAQASLPMPKTLPVFSFANVKDTKLSEQPATTTTVITKVDESSDKQVTDKRVSGEFKFSTPTIGKANKAESETPKKPTVNANSVLSPITFTEPEVKQISNCKASVIDEKWSKLIQKDDSKWSCPTCMIKNDNSQLKCLACEEPKPGSKPAEVKTNENDINKSNVNNEVEKNNLPPMGWGDKFKPAASTWECDTCMVRNQTSVSKCVACETPRAGAAVEAQSLSQSYSGFSFSKATSVPIVKFGFSSNEEEKKDAEEKSVKKVTFSEIIQSSEPKGEIVNNKSDSEPVNGTASKPVDSGFQFSVKENNENSPAKESPKKPEFVFGFSSPPKTITTTTTSTTVSSPAFVFGSSSSLAPPNLFTNTSSNLLTNSNSKEGFKFSAQKFPDQQIEAATAEKTTSNLFKFGASPSKETPNIFATTNNISTTTTTAPTAATITTTATDSSSFKFSFGGAANFAAKSGTSTTDSASQGFSFGGSSNFAAPTTKPSTFLFGSSSKPDESSGFKFSFTTAASTPTTTTTTTSSSTPTFGFNAKPSTFQPSFTFGSQPSSSSLSSSNPNSFVFGSSNPPPPPAAAAQTTPFTFGSNEAQFKSPAVFGSADFNQNKFQFGQQQPLGTAGFNFGQSASAVPQMNFSQTPSFNFGGAQQPSTAPQQQSGGVFQFAASGPLENPFAFSQGASGATAGRNIKKAKRRLNPK